MVSSVCGCFISAFKCVWVDFNVCGCVVIDFNACGHVAIDLKACGHVVSNF